MSPASSAVGSTSAPLGGASGAASWTPPSEDRGEAGGHRTGPLPAKPAQLPSAMPRITASQRRRFMSGNVSEIRAKPMEPPKSKRRSKGDDEEESEAFKQTLKEVLDFVIPNLGKRERKQYEQQKLRALGATPDKGEKIPYNIMQKAMKKHEAQRQEILAEEKTLGVSTSASAHRQAYIVETLRRKKKKAEKEKVKRREDRTYDLGMGAREKNGMAVIPKRSIARFQQRRGGAK